MPPDAPITLSEIARRLDELSEIVTVKADLMINTAARAEKAAQRADANIAIVGEYVQSLNATRGAILEQFAALERMLQARDDLVEQRMVDELQKLRARFSELPCSEKKRNGNAELCVAGG